MVSPGTTLQAVSTPDLDIARALRPSDGELVAARRRLHRKTLVIAAVLGVSYWVLVFTAHGIAVTALAAVGMVIGLFATATSVFHDGNHGSFSTSRIVNRMAGYSGDLMGASSWIWKFKHNRLHHGNTNVVGTDMDIEQSPFARLTPQQPWHAWHRYQHVYMWFLYGFLTLQWFLVSDFIDLAQRGIGGHRFPRQPRPRDVMAIALGKLLHLTWAVAIPLMFHAWWVVLVVYVSISWSVGLLLATTFQLAHCTELVEFVDDDAPRRGEYFVDHQLRTTADFGGGSNVGSRAVHWMMGGLDHQVEHHLAPRLPHTIYPLVATRMGTRSDGTAQVRQFAGLVPAVRAHGSWLRRMGRRPQ
jgi:linoleoyl-CoA desaturase